MTSLWSPPVLTICPRCRFCIRRTWSTGRLSTTFSTRCRCRATTNISREKVYGHRQFVGMTISCGCFSARRMKAFSCARLTIPGVNGARRTACSPRKAGLTPARSGMTTATPGWCMLLPIAAAASSISCSCLPCRLTVLLFWAKGASSMTAAAISRRWRGRKSISAAAGTTFSPQRAASRRAGKPCCAPAV